MKRNHAIKQDVCIALRVWLERSILRRIDRQLPKVSPDEIPSTFLSILFELETLFQAAVGSIRGNHEVVFYRRAGDLSIRTLLLVECPNVSHNKACARNGL